MIRVCRCAFYRFLAANPTAHGSLELGPGSSGQATWTAPDGAPIAQATRKAGEPTLYEVSPARAILSR